MYAIIQTGGKQYKVEKGAKIRVDKLDANEGSEIQIPEVLVVSSDNGSAAKIGQPHVAGSVVKAMVLAQMRAPKIIVFKKRSKKTYKKTIGHRQNYTELLIKAIAPS